MVMVVIWNAFLQFPNIEPNPALFINLVIVYQPSHYLQVLIRKETMENSEFVRKELYSTEITLSILNALNFLRVNARKLKTWRASGPGK